MALIAMNIAMGIVNTSDVKDFSSTDPILSHPLSQPNQVSIDGQMKGTKSRMSFLQYMPMKPSAKGSCGVCTVSRRVYVCRRHSLYCIGNSRDEVSAALNQSLILILICLAGALSTSSLHTRKSRNVCLSAEDLSLAPFLRYY